MMLLTLSNEENEHDARPLVFLPFRHRSGLGLPFLSNSNTGSAVPAILRIIFGLNGPNDRTILDSFRGLATRSVLPTIKRIARAARIAFALILRRNVRVRLSLGVRVRRDFLSARLG
jgi:hypothetical protein